jgi:hypothetical protein
MEIHQPKTVRNASLIVKFAVKLIFAQNARTITFCGQTLTNVRFRVHQITFKIKLQTSAN